MLLGYILCLTSSLSSVVISFKRDSKRSQRAESGNLEVPFVTIVANSLIDVQLMRT